MKALSNLKNFTTLSKTQQSTISGGFIGANCGIDPCAPPKPIDNSDNANK
ncbi:hypothetical protein [Aquimarina pacifica]|nr:hypothetical protein [Aquimarina pacifica]